MHKSPPVIFPDFEATFPCSKIPGFLRRIIRRFETGERALPTSIARLAWMYGHHGIPAHVQWKAGGEENTYALLPYIVQGGLWLVIRGPNVGSKTPFGELVYKSPL
jgi:hypothetical protein